MDRAARNRSRGIRPRVVLRLRWPAIAVLLSLLAAPARGQLGDAIPSTPYFVAVNAFYAGEYRDAPRPTKP